VEPVHPEPYFIGLENYAAMFDDPLFWRVVQNTVVYVAGTIPITMALALTMAILLNERLGRMRNVYRVAAFYPTMIPMAAAAMLWVWLLNPGIGLINHYLAALGIARIEWLYNMDWALPAIMVTSIWKNFGYFMLIYLAGLQNLPERAVRVGQPRGCDLPAEGALDHPAAAGAHVGVRHRGRHHHLLQRLRPGAPHDPRRARQPHERPRVLHLPERLPVLGLGHGLGADGRVRRRHPRRDPVHHARVGEAGAL
jgi:hypothetical protein